MNKLRSLAMWLVIASGAVSVALAADKKPEPFTKERLHEIAATVESIDVPTRTVSLKGPKGNVKTIVVDPEVRNLENIHVGDKVHVGYYEGVVAEIKDKSDTNTTSASPAAATATYRAPPGEKPAAAAGRAVNATVKIQSVDTKANTVTFIRPDGLWRTLNVESPEGKKFISTLKPGNEVSVTYVEALAIEVKKEEKAGETTAKK
jgi:hypothetical protein